MEKLESHGILDFHFPGLESHGNVSFHLSWKVVQKSSSLYKINSAVVFWHIKKQDMKVNGSQNGSTFSFKQNAKLRSWKTLKGSSSTLITVTTAVFMVKGLLYQANVYKTRHARGKRFYVTSTSSKSFLTVTRFPTVHLSTSEHHQFCLVWIKQQMVVEAPIPASQQL